jgi:hypothetical protein
MNKLDYESIITAELEKRKTELLERKKQLLNRNFKLKKEVDKEDK